MVNVNDSQVPAIRKRKGEENLTDIDKKIIRRPKRLNPWSKRPESSENGSVWIHMNAYKIINQFSKGRGKVIRAGSPEAQYAFLAPLSIFETHDHQWQPYESIASRLAQKVRSLATVTAEVGALTTAFTSQANTEDSSVQQINREVKEGGRFDMQVVENLAAKAYSRAPSSRVPKIKIDTPLYYENSDRRSIQLEFLLVAEEDPFTDIVEPIQNIMRKAAPAFTGELTIEFPYLWEVYSQPNRYLNYSTCVLSSIQPTWNAPYINGYPSNVVLSLRFVDLGPLYRQTIETGTSINVIDADKQRAREQNEAVTVISRSRFTAGTRTFR